MKAVRNVAASDASEVVLKSDRLSDPSQKPELLQHAVWVGAVLAILLFILLLYVLRRKNHTV